MSRRTCADRRSAIVGDRSRRRGGGERSKRAASGERSRTLGRGTRLGARAGRPRHAHALHAEPGVRRGARALGVAIARRAGRAPGRGPGVRADVVGPTVGGERTVVGLTVVAARARVCRRVGRPGAGPATWTGVVARARDDGRERYEKRGSEDEAHGSPKRVENKHATAGSRLRRFRPVRDPARSRRDGRDLRSHGRKSHGNWAHFALCVAPAQSERRLLLRAVFGVLGHLRTGRPVVNCVHARPGVSALSVRGGRPAGWQTTGNGSNDGARQGICSPERKRDQVPHRT